MADDTLFDTIRPELARLEQQIETVLKGKTEQVRLAIITLLARGHLLVEDVPGVGKTTLAHLLSSAVDCDFKRVQFTSDLLPSDLLGVTVFQQKSGEFQFVKGPIFTNFLVADEINRSTPKTQSGLLEAMSANSVSMENETHTLPAPFMVLATQNPIEVHGTFPLPQSQLDRFLMRIGMGYPGREAELSLLREQKQQVDFGKIEPVISSDEIVALQNQVADIKITDELLEYLTEIVDATRESEKVEVGVSTRGAIALRDAAKARALFFGRDYVVPDDFQHLAPLVLAHRIQMAETLDFSGSASGSFQSIDGEFAADFGGLGEDRAVGFIRSLLTKIPVPV